ncbi:apolipoprotein R-like [Watersipora subatra]|uniref:apolipoprotein R-like n=1 Tax=Watersipora subatra TaxID=2589382 RepID=UPI00355B6ACA
MATQEPCPPIPHIDNGQGLDTGDTVRYACEPGYVLEGTNVITCVNGRWTVAPRCTRQLCPKPPNVPFSTEPTLSNGGVTATYTCLSGYRIIGGNGVTSRVVNCNTQSQFWPNLPSCEL